MTASTPPYIPRYGIGAPTGTAAKGTLYFDIQANYTPYIYNGGWQRSANMIIGAGVPSFKAPPGFLYSRSDAAELYSSQPVPGTPTIVQSASAHNTGSGSTVTLGAAPTPGNLMLGFFLASSNTINVTSNWTPIIRGGNNGSITSVYRYAQSGDTAITPPIKDNSSIGYGLTVYEISGISGNPVQDIANTSSFYGANAAFNVPSISTATANQLALTAACWNGGSVGFTTPTGFTDDMNVAQVLLGSGYTGHQFIASGGTAVSPNYNRPTSAINNSGNGQTILIAPGTSANWTLL